MEYKATVRNESVKNIDKLRIDDRQTGNIKVFEQKGDELKE